MGSADGRLVYNLMFFVGIGVMLALVAGGAALVIKLLPKPVRRFPAGEFIEADEIRIPVDEQRYASLTPDSPDFKEFAGNFTDKRRPEDDTVVSELISVSLLGARFSVQVSMEGWNFLGEAKNCRRLENPMQVMQILHAVKRKNK
ncbi:MAG: hypothetical protein MJA29_10265 [Candidatus Omnitrophica bacterium]|nr:hypothetical protein [Candidatus Omnitrophota bacterium]